MRSVLYVYLTVLSAMLLSLAAATQEMKQLTLADVNQAAEQQQESAVRLARQLGFGRRIGRFGTGGGFGGGGGRFGPGAGGFLGNGGGFGGGGFGRRRLLGRRRFANPLAFFG